MKKPFTNRILGVNIAVTNMQNAVNLIISSPFKKPYTSLYALKLSRSKYNTANSSFLDNLFFNSACICTFPGNPVNGLTVLFVLISRSTFFIV